MGTTRTARLFIGALPLAVLWLVVPALALSAGSTAVAAAPGDARAPFADGQTWYVFQGYNSGTHQDTSKYGVDLTTSRSTTASAGASVVAPAAGRILYWQATYGNLCINTPDGRSYTLTHINASKTSGTVSAGERLGTVAPAGQAGNNNVAHLHYEWWAGAGCYGQSNPIPFDAGNRNRICGAPDMTPSGPSDWGNGTWSGTAITATTCGSPSTSPQGALDGVEATAKGQVRVRGWAFDRDRATSPIAVHVYVGGPAGSGEGHALTADTHRPDVGRAHPGVGDHHGFDATLETTRYGRLSVYVYAINASGTGGQNVLLGSVELWVTPRAYEGTHWEKVGSDRFARISLGPKGLLWAVSKKGKIAQYVGAGKWERRGSGFRDVAVGMPHDAATGGPQVYALTKDGRVRRWRDSTWEEVPGRFVSIDFGADSDLWAVRRSGVVVEYAGGGEWTPRGDGFVSVTTGMPVDADRGGPRTYAVRQDQTLQRFRGGAWEDVPGRASSIDFGLGELWAVRGKGRLFEYVGGGAWERRGSRFRAVAVGMPGDGVDSPRVYALRKDGTVVRWRR